MEGRTCCRKAINIAVRCAFVRGPNWCQSVVLAEASSLAVRRRPQKSTSRSERPGPSVSAGTLKRGIPTPRCWLPFLFGPRLLGSPQANRPGWRVRRAPRADAPSSSNKPQRQLPARHHERIPAISPPRPRLPPRADVVDGVHGSALVSYNAGISACEKGEQWQQSLSLLSAMRKAKLEPNVSYKSGNMAREKGRIGRRSDVICGRRS